MVPVRVPRVSVTGVAVESGHTENECDCCGDESTTVYVVANGGSVPVVTMAAAVVVWRWQWWWWW